MAWEIRGRHRCLYRSFRSADGHVRKAYLGTGAAAQAEERRRTEAQSQQKADAQAANSLAADLVPVDAMAEQLDEAIDTLVEATLRVSGFHKHKYTWRKQRG